MKSQNTKSSDELHREVKQEIRNVERDLNQMQGRLSPGQLIDDAIFYPHGRNMSSTLDHLKRNPVGTAFLSLGTLMLMEDENHSTMEANARIKLGEARSKLGDLKQQVKNQMPHKELSPGTAPNMADIAKGKVTEMKGKMMDVKSSVQSKVSEIKDTVQTKMSDVRSSVSEAQDDFSERVTDIKEGVTDKVSEFQSSSTEEGTDWKQDLRSSLESGKEKMQNIDPLTYMALGAGLGALTGAALPVSDKEQSFVDDKLKDRISSFSEDLQTAINDCAGLLKDMVVQDVKDYSLKIF
jgi:uncharacterized protein YjbJ (UPF0337 family)